MTAVLDGVIDMDDVFEETISFCLGCRACEPVCPSMVPYGRTLEGARAEIFAQKGRGRPAFEGLDSGDLAGESGDNRDDHLGDRTGPQRTGLARIAPRRLRRGLEGLRRVKWITPSLLGKPSSPIRILSLPWGF